MLIKADFHIHTSEDTKEPAELSAYELIDIASELAYGVLAITNHDLVTYDGELREYAAQKGIILLPGAEISINGRKHVLVINSALRGDEPGRRVRTFDDLAAVRNSGTLVIAPHPFHRAPVCLGRSLEEHLGLFDAVESSHFYSHRINLNREAEEFAQRHGLPLVGTSDAHFRFQFGRAYSLVEAEPEPIGVVQAVKAGMVRCVCPPLTVPGMAWVLLRMGAAGLAHAMRRSLARAARRRMP